MCWGRKPTWVSELKVFDTTTSFAKGLKRHATEQQKKNFLYFEGSTMRGLYEAMENWQNANDKRLLSISVQQDGDTFCCIALSNPTEVVITSSDGKHHVDLFCYDHTYHLRVAQF